MADRSELPNRRRVSTGLAAVLIAGAGLALAGCGKKGPPQPPSGADSRYPRTYPKGATPDPEESDREL